ncbi:MAG: universal stress protein [Aliihoeflea sp.]|uniref:universal stress protein n=1 Tax=Aliihoeflea sp. TaxID=2608088 RepID=UPI004037B3F5
MTKNILCCLNRSAHAQRAVKFAVELGAKFDSEVNFLVVNEIKPSSGYPPVPTWTEAEVQEMLEIACRYARTHGAKRTKRIVFESSDAASAILECANEIGADHIVVGTGNPPFIGRVLLGSVSEAVVISATCSVTVAR